MNALENLLIIAGISLDIFAAMECQGSLVAKIDKKQLVKLCALIAAWQMAALFVGSYLSGLLYRNTITHNEKVTGFVIAAAIFFCLGVFNLFFLGRSSKENPNLDEYGTAI